MRKHIFSAAVLGAALIAATPAGAVITTFATFRPSSTAFNVRYSNPTNGTSASIFTIGSANSTVPGAASVVFSFLQPVIGDIVTSAAANFTLSASLANRAATLSGNTLIQDGISGFFEFRSTQAYTVGSTTYNAGALLLRGVFTDAQIVGQRNGTTANFSASAPTTAGETLTYTSDFLTFPNVTSTDFSISLTGVQSVLQAAPSGGVPNRALRSFRGVSSGNFSVDPAPLINGVPEPATWGLMVLGFGLVGASMRRRRRATVAA